MLANWVEIRHGLVGRGLIIHHWDTDGICSTRLLLEQLEADNITPMIGEYTIPEEAYRIAETYKWVMIVDMALQEEDIQRISEKAKVTIIDHHSQPPLKMVQHINPVADGADSENYPSCTWVINRLLSNVPDIYTVLGIVGDRGVRVKENPYFWSIIQDYLAKENLTFDDLERMVNLLDSSFRVGHRHGVVEAPRILKQLNGPSDIMSYPDWLKNLDEIQVEVARVLSAPPNEIEGVALKLFSSKANIISTIAREMAWKRGLDTVVVNTGYFPDMDQVYARSNRKDMTSLIEFGVKKGYSAGGKRDVLGAVVPKEETEEYVSVIVEYLSQQIRNPPWTNS